MSKKYAIIATVIILAIGGGIYVWQKTKEAPASPNGDESLGETASAEENEVNGSFVRFEVQEGWEIQTFGETELPPFSIAKDKFLDKPIKIYQVETNAPIILKGIASSDIEKLEVTWILINTGGYTRILSAPKKNWVTLPVENFSLGDTAWEFKAALGKNLNPLGYPQQYTVIGTTQNGTKIYDHILLSKIKTAADRAFIKSKQDAVNKPTIEGAKEFAGNLDRYQVDNYASTTLMKNVTAHVLWYSDKYCKAHSDTFIEMIQNCSGYTGGFLVLYDSKKQKNYYLEGGFASVELQGSIDFYYDPTTKILKTGYFAEGDIMGLLPEEEPKPRIINTINLSNILKD